MPQKTKLAQIALLILTVTFAGCSSSGNQTPNFASEKTGGSPAGTQSAASDGADSRNQTVSLEQADKAQNNQIVERKIIRNATLALEANAPEDASRKIAQIVESKSGFVVTSDTQQRDAANGGSQTTRVTMTVRVPAAQFDNALAEIRQTAARVSQEKISGQDVTEEFIDLEARIKTKRALEEQFLEIMRQSRSVADALEVQKQLATVRGEIESLEGKRKFLENQTNLSTITITIGTPAIFAGSTSGFFYQIWEALSDGVEAALWVVLALIRVVLALLPLIILFGVPLLLLIRYLNRKRKREKLAQQFAQQENKQV